MALGMDEAHIVAAGAFANSPGCEAYALGLQPRDSGRKVVDPEPYVIERGLMNARPSLGVERLHEVDLEPERAVAEHRDVFLHVLALDSNGARDLEAEQIDPEAAQSLLVESAHSDLLYAQNSKRSLGHARLRHEGTGPPCYPEPRSGESCERRSLEP